MRIFRIPFKITQGDNASLLNRVFDYLNSYFNARIQSQEVTFSTNMNTDVAGDKGDIVRCSTDNTYYGCTVSGAAGSATWVAFN